MQIFKNPNFDFLRWRWHAIALSWVVILAGLVDDLAEGMPLGVEFAGGTIVIVQFDQPPDSPAGPRRARPSDCPAAARTRSSSATAIRRRDR